MTTAGFVRTPNEFGLLNSTDATTGMEPSRSRWGKGRASSSLVREMWGYLNCLNFMC